MPIDRAGRPDSPSTLRRRGTRRLSALTAGAGVASVLAAGAIAVALPGSNHAAGNATGAAASTTQPASGAHATSGASGAAGTSSATTGTGGAASGASSSASSGSADATSGAS